MTTTGQLAKLTGLSEKAIRLYTEKGLLVANRDSRGHRRFDETQTERALNVQLLRAIGLSLAEVKNVIDDDKPVEKFDSSWGKLQQQRHQEVNTAEYVRGALIGQRNLENSLKVSRRTCAEQIVLGHRTSATLPQLAAEISAATEGIFAELRTTGTALSGPVYVEYLTRATENYPAELRVCVPIADVIKPPISMELVIRPACEELYVELNQAAADNQLLVVSVHDFLSSESSKTRVGPNREIYFPEFGTGVPGTVMQIAVPVE